MTKVLQVVTDMSWPGGDNYYLVDLMLYLAKYSPIEFAVAEIREHACSENIGCYKILEDAGIPIYTITPDIVYAERRGAAHFVADLVRQLKIDVLHSHLFLTDVICMVVKHGSASVEIDALTNNDINLNALNRIIGSRVHEISSEYENILPWEQELNVDVVEHLVGWVSTKHMGDIRSLAHEHQLREQYSEDDFENAQSVNVSLQRYVSRLASTVVTITQSATDIWSEFSGNVKYVPVTISPPSETLGKGLLGEERADNNDSSRYIFVGRLVQKKRPLELLKAFIEHIETFPNDTLTIIGSGPLENQCMKISNGVENVRICGFLNRDKVWSELLNSHALCLFSSEEGLPLAIQEAMYAGKPILASMAGGISDLVEDDKSGFLLEQVNPALIKETLKRFSLLTSDLKMKMGCNAKKIVSSWSNAGSNFDHYAEIYSCLPTDIGQLDD